MPAVLGDSGGPVLALGLEVLATAMSLEADAAYGAASGAPDDAGCGADGAAGGTAGAATVDDAGGAGGDAGSSSSSSAVATPVLDEVGRGAHVASCCILDCGCVCRRGSLRSIQSQVGPLWVPTVPSVLFRPARLKAKGCMCQGAPSFLGQLFSCMYWCLTTDAVLHASTLGWANSPRN
jgi:hypothetical protein